MYFSILNIAINLNNSLVFTFPHLMHAREGGEREGWPIKQRNDINQLGSTEVGDREIVPEPN